MTVYVVLYQDLRLNTCKVSQEGYKKLSEAVDFCKSRMGVQSWADLLAIYSSQSSEGKWVFGNSATKQQYTIVEVTI